MPVHTRLIATDSPGESFSACARIVALAFLIALCPSLGIAEDVRWLSPPSLQKGDVVMLVAPSGPVDRKRILDFQRVIKSKGYRAIIPGSLFRTDGYLAGDDATRVAELNAAIRDPNVDAIFPCRGGYGLTRILDKIDYESLRKHPKLVIGFSDVTALHLAIARKSRLITLHSPMPQAFLFSDADRHRKSNEVFWSFVQGEPYGHKEPPIDVIGSAHKPSLRAICGGQAEGRLVGGNLTLICATLGTPFAIEPKDKILVIEDTGERPYRIDRYMSQLKLAGVLDQLAGIVIGDFTDAQPEADRIIAEYLRPIGIPAIAGFPLGHEAENLTLPLGALAKLDADALSLTITEWPVSPSSSSGKHP